MRRRELLMISGGAIFALLPVAAPRADTAKVLRVGMATIVPRSALPLAAFVSRMAELGYREGANFALEHVQVADTGGYSAGFQELVARHVDIILAFGNEVAARAARAAANGRPIVLLALAFDPIAKGFAASLAHPGGNVTGLFVEQIELAAKRVELIHEAVPTLRALGLPFDAASRDQAKAASDAAERLKAEPRVVEVVGEPPDFSGALDRLSDPPVNAVLIPESPLFVRHRDALVALLLQRRIPAIGAAREDAEHGALMSYGANFTDTLRHAADYVDRIAKGAKAMDLPIEQPTKFELVINLKTASALGLTVPQSLLARADEVIE